MQMQSTARRYRYIEQTVQEAYLMTRTGSHIDPVIPDVDQTPQKTPNQSQELMAKLEKVRNSVFLLHAISVGAIDVCEPFIIPRRRP